MQDSVVPISARNTVNASHSMKIRPPPGPKRAVPTTIIMSPMAFTASRRRCSRRRRGRPHEEVRIMARLGFAGLGTMGGNMVARLLEKGHTVTGYNRTRSKAEWLLGRGMLWAETPRELAAASDVTFSMVTNAAALAAATP